MRRLAEAGSLDARDPDQVCDQDRHRRAEDSQGSGERIERSGESQAGKGDQRDQRWDVVVTVVKPELSSCL